MSLLRGIFLIALGLTIVATAIPRSNYDYQTIRDVGGYGFGYFLTFPALQSAWDLSLQVLQREVCLLHGSRHIFCWVTGVCSCADQHGADQRVRVPSRQPGTIRSHGNNQPWLLPVQSFHSKRRMREREHRGVLNQRQ
jgi:hypothetical protein